MNYVTLSIAIIVAFITIQQFLLARERFKLDLFDRRFGIYRATQVFLDEILKLNRDNAKDASKWLLQYSKDVQAAIFLFDEPLYKYLNELWKLGNVMAVVYNLVNDPINDNPELRERFIEVAKIREKMIIEQSKLSEKFSPYLKFSNWKYGFILDVISIPKDS
jgi:hypothetical protein